MGDIRGTRQWFATAALVALGLGLYVGVQRHSFLHFDDADYITENAIVSQGLTREGVRWAFTAFHAGNWHPLTWLSHMLDVELFGMHPGAHKLVNAGLHAATSLVLLLVFVRMTGRFWPSCFVAVLFGVHPLHVESIAWVAERKDVLSTFWWAMTIAAYLRYVSHPNRARMAAVLALYALALLSKPMVVTMPVLLLVLDFWPLRRFEHAGRGSSQGRLLREKLPLVAMAAAASVVTLFAQRSGGAIQTADAFPWLARLANVPVAYVAYVLKTLWPVNLAALYPYPASIPGWQTAGSTALLVAISWAVFRQRVIRPWFAAGWAWFLVTLLPVIGLIQVGSQPFADRYMYVPIIGLFVMIAWGVSALDKRQDPQEQRSPTSVARTVAGSAAVAAVAALSLLTYRQVGVWQNDITLWEHALRVTEGNYRAHTNLGFALEASGQTDRAIAQYREAIGLQPGYANARNYLGALLSERGDHASAAVELRAALASRPRFVEAHNNLGIALAGLGQPGDAIGAFREAVRLNPAFGPAWNNLGAALAEAGQIGAAIQAFEQSVKYQPQSAEAHFNLGTALREAGRTSEAAAHFEEARRRK